MDDFTVMDSAFRMCSMTMTMQQQPCRAAWLQLVLGEIIARLSLSAMDAHHLAGLPASAHLQQHARAGLSGPHHAAGGFQCKNDKCHAQLTATEHETWLRTA